MFEVNVNGRTQRYRSKPTMNVDTTGSSGDVSIPKPLTYDYMPEGYPKKDGWSVEWDGNIDGKIAAVGAPIYKISDMVLSADDLLGAMVTVPDYPEKNHSLLTDEIQQILEDIIGVRILDGVFIVKKDNVYWNGVTFPENGVYSMAVNPKFKIAKENITPMSTDFLPKNLNVVFKKVSGTQVNCNVTYNELRDWVERDVPVFSVYISDNSRFNITEITLLTNMLGFVYYANAGTSKSFVYKSDGTIEIQPDES